MYSTPMRCAEGRNRKTPRFTPAGGRWQRLRQGLSLFRGFQGARSGPGCQGIALSRLGPRRTQKGSRCQKLTPISRAYSPEGSCISPHPEPWICSASASLWIYGALDKGTVRICPLNSFPIYLFYYTFYHFGQMDRYMYMLLRTCVPARALRVECMEKSVHLSAFYFCQYLQRVAVITQRTDADSSFLANFLFNTLHRRTSQKVRERSLSRLLRPLCFLASIKACMMENSASSASYSFFNTGSRNCSSRNSSNCVILFSKSRLAAQFALCYTSNGRALRKEDTPMRFLRDVAVAVLASLIAALVLRLLNG